MTGLFWTVGDAGGAATVSDVRCTGAEEAVVTEAFRAVEVTWGVWSAEGGGDVRSAGGVEGAEVVGLRRALGGAGAAVVGFFRVAGAVPEVWTFGDAGVAGGADAAAGFFRAAGAVLDV
ncbi:hypothetical protein [Streptomyces cinereoruber]|uniref:hypothetical protein n=1 Tax=Streptomyces cinereoruber TaxID=67260 RepID=UPI003C2C9956